MITKLVIFGITGDLAQRKLLPALRTIAEHEDLQIIGVSRRAGDAAAVSGGGLDGRTRLITMDLAETADYARLKAEIALGENEQALIYLSVPPNAAAEIVDHLGEAGINGSKVKLLFEKPFGYDLSSAQDFLTRTARYYDEAQLYRIDHYAAKEIAGRLIELRLDDETKHHGWNRDTVAAVEVIATETIGVEGRAAFYEQTGALRDFVQGHLMQLLALVLMEIPAGAMSETVPAYRLKALEQLAEADPGESVRAQYDGYADEVGNPGSTVETFAQVALTSRDPRWQGVPLTLTTGKALDKKRSFVTIHYKDGSEEIFDEAAVSGGGLDAYERVLLDAVHGNKMIFTTGDEVLQSWRALAEVQTAWELGSVPLGRYTRGATVADILERH